MNCHWPTVVIQGGHAGLESKKPGENRWKGQLNRAWRTNQARLWSRSKHIQCRQRYSMASWRGDPVASEMCIELEGVGGGGGGRPTLRPGNLMWNSERSSKEAQRCGELFSTVFTLPTVRYLDLLEKVGIRIRCAFLGISSYNL